MSESESESVLVSDYAMSEFGWVGNVTYVKYTIVVSPCDRETGFLEYLDGGVGWGCWAQHNSRRQKDWMKDF